MTDDVIIQAFHAMWDKFPEPVMMIKRSREIIALNPACEASGLQPGMKCSSVGSPEQHKGCRCNQAIDTASPVCVAYQSAKGQAYGYWIPVAEKPEWILHFSVGVYAEYLELLPQTIQIEN